MNKIFLGIDTSNYMTSVCMIDENRQILYESRKLLEVKKGERGLQQSEAVFQHVKNIPRLLEDITSIPNRNLSGVGVSQAPRPIKGSYMPVFMTGVAVAESIAYLNGIPITYTTHQEGHIAAGYYSADKRPMKEDFLAIHISGGTSEMLHIEKNKSGYNIKKIGGTLDLHAGQLIDRIGVLLGLPFPAGKHLEEHAAKSIKEFKRFPSAVKDFSFHLSGAENEAKKRIAAKEKTEEIARAIEHVIAVSIEKIIRKAVEANYPKGVLIVGGVAQNQYIRDHLLKRLEHQAIGATLYFANKQYSGDNAYGVANIALNND